MYAVSYDTGGYPDVRLLTQERAATEAVWEVIVLLAIKYADAEQPERVLKEVDFLASRYLHLSIF